MDSSVHFKYRHLLLSQLLRAYGKYLLLNKPANIYQNKSAFQSNLHHPPKTYITEIFTNRQKIDFCSLDLDTVLPWPWPSDGLDLSVSGIQAIEVAVS